MREVTILTSAVDDRAWRFAERTARLGEGITRFAGAGSVPPFPAYVRQPEELGEGAAPTGYPAPRFAMHDGRAVVEMVFDGPVSFFGTGEQTGPMRRNSSRRFAWNFDASAYKESDHALYQSHPFILCVRADGSCVGVIIESTYRCEFDLGERALSVGVSGPMPAVTVIERATAGEVVVALTELIGRAAMPPMWALGYHQCRWSYQPAERFREIAREFRAREIPCDVLWFDIDYMDGFRCFTVDPEKFPDMRGLTDELRGQGFKSVLMLDPGIKVDPAYSVYAEGAAAGHFVKTAEGEDFVGSVWPGPCSFPDYTNQRVRQWWAGVVEAWQGLGVDGVWNDMNEPAIFDRDDKTMPLDNRHHADEQWGGPDVHARYHNVYGMLMSLSTRMGMMAAQPQKRPFVLTRATFLGGHRYAATWTGDNSADWNHLRWSIPMTINLGLCGQPFAGPDIGGFLETATPELFARWMGIGALLPFARAHKVKEAVDSEPWCFGPEVEHACRVALRRRYRLLPYLYTLFEEATRTGMPLARPVFFADPGDAALHCTEDAFLLGEGLLVRADVTPPGVHATPSALPRGIWRRFEPVEHNPHNPELMLKGGAIVPMGPVMQFVGERPLDELTLVVSLNNEGYAEGELYEDAGEGFGYKRGEYLRTTYRAQLRGGAVVVEVAGVEGSRPRPRRPLIVVLLRDGQEPLMARGEDGSPVTVA